MSDWYHPRIGGIERQVGELARRLAAAGHDVTVITPYPHAADDAPGVHVRRVPASILPGAGVLWAPAAFRRVGAVIRLGNFDVVHAHTSIISPAAFAALYHAQKAGLAAVSTTHSILGSWAGLLGRLNWWWHWSDWPVVFAAVSERVRGEIRRLAPSRPVLVLPNAIDPGEWSVQRHPPSEAIVFTSVMRLAARKRGAALLRAFHRLRVELPADVRVQLRIAGDGPARRRLERLAHSLGLADSVQFLGFRSPAEVRALLASSHAFVLASRYEAFGIAALEARAAGLPVVAMREGGVREFIADGVDGLLADDDEEFAGLMLRLCRDPRLRRAIAEHNVHTPVACTWDRVLAAHLAAYDLARDLCAARAIPRAA